MRIGYLVPEFPGQTHAFFWREVQALREMGCAVNLLSTRAPSRDACTHAFADEARGQTQYLFPPSVRAALRALNPGLSSSVRGYLARMTGAGLRARAQQRALVAAAFGLLDFCREKEIEHVHAHSCANAAHVAALCRLLGGPSYSLTLHGDLDVYGSDHGLKFENAAFVSVVTRALQRQVGERLGLHEEFLPVIRMGVDTERFVPVTRVTTTSKFTAVTVARLNHTKGHVYALEAIAALNRQGVEIEYKIAGAGPERESIERHIKQLNISQQVALLGNLGEQAVGQLLTQADVFLLTSFGLGEAAPVSVMEAMASGTPVISSRIGGTTEMIDDGVDGMLVSQKNVDEISSSLRLLAESPELRGQIAAAARGRATRDFDFRQNAALLLARFKGSPQPRN